MKTRQGYHTEQIRNESYKQVLEDEKDLNEKCLIVFNELKSGPKSLQEISKISGMKEHLVSARLNELRKADFVITAGEKIINPETNKPNSLWKINPDKLMPKQLNIFQ